jgi:hypothetical protein
MKLKARSMTMAWGATAAACAAAYYVAWMCWLYGLGVYSQLNIGFATMARPDVLAELIGDLNKEGSWYLFKDLAPSGLFLSLIWLVEAGTIGGIAFYRAHSAMAAKVFCEHCEKWGTRQQLTQLRTADPAALKAELEAGHVEALATAEPKRATDTTWCVVDLEGCADCDTLQTLRLDQCVETVDKDGKVTVKVKPLIRRMILTPEQTVQLAMVAAGAARGGGGAAGA